MKQRIRLTESQLHRMIKESVKEVLNEVDSSTIYNAYVKASDDYFDASPRKQKQCDNFENEMEKRVIEDLANDEYFWSFDFDESEWKGRLPKNFNRLSRTKQAEVLIDASDWSIEDWARFLYTDEGF